MSVSLKIISFKDQPYDKDDAVILDKNGGSIGRLDSSDMALPDQEKIVSRHHATVSYDNGNYILTDCSLAGTFIDNAQDPINKSSVTLTDGMVLGIGEYLIQVNILPDEDETPFSFSAEETNVSPFAEVSDSPFDSDNALLDATEDTSQLTPLDTDSPFSIDQFAAPDGGQKQEDFVSSSDSGDSFASLHDSFIPPSPTGDRHANDEIPEDFNFEDFFKAETSVTQSEEPLKEDLLGQRSLLDQAEKSNVEAQPLNMADSAVTEKQTPTRSETVDDTKLLQAFFQGAGIKQDESQDASLEDKMRRIGHMFRQFTESTVAVLRSRAEFKSMFRVSVTTIKRTDNNPLKFSVTTDEAVQHLMNDGQGGFKKSVDAIDEGFQDVLNHQMAMQAGIQASLQEILQQFEPEQIEKLYEEGIVLNKKAKCWEKYQEIYGRLAETAVEEFYGDAFAEAYEKQMKQIKTVNQKN